MSKNNTVIPKKIHFIWFGTKMPWEVKQYIELTRAKYPEYKLKIWSEKDFDVKKHKFTRLAYEAKKWAFVSDYFRVKILSEHGGVYLDTDMIPIGDMRPFLDHAMVLGFEYSKMVTTGFLASTAKHPMLQKIKEEYERFDEVVDEEVKFLINNELWTYMLEKFCELKTNDEEQLLTSDIKIYPKEYFADMKENDKSIYLHDHQLSWTSPTKAKAMNAGLKFTRKFQWWLNPALTLQKWSYYRKNKKAIKKNKKAQIVNEEIRQSTDERNLESTSVNEK